MSEQPTTPRRRASSETGLLPRVDIEPETAHEPPQPPVLPEFDTESAGITGRIPTYHEGEDEAKLADDSATMSDHQQPRQFRVRRW